MKNFMYLMCMFSCCYFSCNNGDDDPSPGSGGQAVACFTFNAPICAAGGCSVSFDASCSENAVTYNWNFGDGSVERTGQNLTHTFETSGTFTVTLTVNDSVGVESESSENIEIEIPTATLFPTMVPIEGGNFLMGSKVGDLDERPVNEITVGTFDMSETEITFAQYDFFCDQTGRVKPKDLGFGRGDRPVIFVSWDDAVAYCNWLSGETGDNYRLPTEAEWEFAAGGGINNRTVWAGTNNENELSTFGNLASTSGADNFVNTAPVKSFVANQLGLFDLSGNVEEWCFDWYGEAYYLETNPGAANPQGPAAGSEKVLRGGNFSDEAQNTRVASRNAASPTVTNSLIGFRVVKALN